MAAHADVEPGLMSEQKSVTNMAQRWEHGGDEHSVAADDADMRRLGKKQQFKRGFHLTSITAFSVITLSGWVYVPSTVAYGLSSGQTGGLFVMYLVSFTGLFMVILVLAEMSSMAPTAGGQYHWVSEFAPVRLQRVLSYTVGWLSSLAWLSGTCGGMYPAGFTLQGLILLANPDYNPKPYQCYLFVVMIASSGLLVNSILARYLPKLEGFVFIMFSLSFLVFMVVLWVLPPHLTASEVFQTFQANTGWSTLGLSMLTSQSNLLFLIIGSDATAHMAEETRNASTVVPKAMVSSYIINGVSTLAFIVTYSFCLLDYETVVENSPTGQLGLPFLQIFANGTGSIRGGQALAAALAVLQIFGTMNYMATCSRQIFAFARDRGLPFSSWMAAVDSDGTFPVNAVVIVWAFVVMLTLITLGSTVAFDAITSLTMLALFSTYMISLSCLLWRRLTNGVQPGPWHLGPFSIPINFIALCYCVFLYIWLPFPTHLPVTAESFNWSWVIYVGILLISALYYAFFARHTYTGPATDVKER